MLIEELRAIVSLTSGKQREYFEAMLQGAHTVYCKPMSEVLPDNLLKHIKRLKIEKKQCYKNATLVAGLNDEIHFIDGKMNFLGIPIEHAWNEYHGQYFDVTKEIALKESVDGVEYLSIGEFTYDYVIDVCFKRKFYGSILYEYFTSVNKNDSKTDVKFKK